jgi:enamine deaminase RidA (YjgF/YER057c/UK114 family)
MDDLVASDAPNATGHGGSFSHMLSTKDFIFVSGQPKLKGPFEAEVLDNIAAALTAASSTVNLRVSVRCVYIADIHTWAGAAQPALCVVPARQD